MDTATKAAPTPLPTAVDLTGLPEHVVREVLRYVDEARGTGPPSPTPEPGADPPAPASLRFASRAPKLAPEELRQLFRSMASRQPGKVLPPDFSRADIYDEYD